MDSILTSIKKLLGIEVTVTNFDSELVMHINSVLMVLPQIGVGPINGFIITSATETWDQLLSIDQDTNLESVKMYVYFKVRLSFDPPSSSFLLESMQRQISEIEWRLIAQAEEVLNAVTSEDPPLESSTEYWFDILDE